MNLDSLRHSTHRADQVPSPSEPGDSDSFWFLDSATLSVDLWRCTTNTYYKSASHRSNYVVLTGAQAIKIEFDHSEEDTVVRRVSCCFKSKPLTARARNNVLPAGILLTPQLLELGGVGNGNVLKKHKISLNVDLPLVGENYQDHILVLIIYKVKKAFVTYDNLGYNHTFRAAAEAQYSKKTRNGPLTAFHFMLSHIDLGYLASSSTIAHIHRSLWKDVKKEKPKDASDRAQHIRILHIFYLSCAFSTLCVVDTFVLVESIKFANKIAMAQSLATTYVTQQNPSADMKSDKDFSKRVEGNNRTLHHSVGTAAMAPKSLRGVVNAELKVCGTSNLRVVLHASVILMHLAARLHHTVYGIAERAADVIKSDSGF
ncbi:GMC oxidoreductase [Rhizoctonia solani]|uniref:GMC oxidoreductase n=1 Tax=Rhizoctonia solani TaxID=456999 RepID=A0A8H7HBI0_9AGAM|nr:GMC oxidoreductase [Rhizoctonia solani]